MEGRTEREREELEILCPCGRSFFVPLEEAGAEHPCPDCGRVNVLPELAPPEAGEASPETTTIQPPPAGPRLVPGEQVGPYRVEHLIGEGGMGRVYAAVDRGLDRRVALKVLSHRFLDRDEFVARFTREARAVAKINHPNIVQIYFTGVHAGVPYYAMEWVDGRNLEACRREGPLEWRRAVELMIQACAGLEAAHRVGVIHRDVKPSNLLVDRTGILKIADFGLAKTVAMDSAITHTGTIIGTPYYMSPEQGEGRPLDERSDIYALGATFYHLLAGIPPFEGPSPISVILKHVHEPLPSLRARNGAVPEALAGVIERMMAKDPAARYPSYTALVEDLSVLQADSTTVKRAGAGLARKGLHREGGPAPAGSGIEAGALPRCGGGRRLLAFFLDYTLLYLLHTVYTEGVVVAGSDHWWESKGFWSVLFLLTTFLYFLLGDGGGGKTLGKILTRCRLARPAGEPLGFMRSGVRTLCFFPALFALGAVPLQGVFKEYLQVYFLVVDRWIGDPARTLAGICFVFHFVNFMCYLVTPEGAFLHDLLSGARLLGPALRRHGKEKKRSAPPSTVHVPPPARPENGSPRKGPPPVPPDWDRPVRSEPPERRRNPRFRPGEGHVYRSPLFAALLSLFPGLGQLYNGHLLKSFFVFLTWWLVLPWLWGILDAYRSARRLNREHIRAVH